VVGNELVGTNTGLGGNVVGTKMGGLGLGKMLFTQADGNAAMLVEDNSVYQVGTGVYVNNPVI
jgi:hypothetical protein